LPCFSSRVSLFAQDDLDCHPILCFPLKLRWRTCHHTRLFFIEMGVL
jgi:hypothetical protein